MSSDVPFLITCALSSDRLLKRSSELAVSIAESVYSLLDCSIILTFRLISFSLSLVLILSSCCLSSSSVDCDVNDCACASSCSSSFQISTQTLPLSLVRVILEILPSALFVFEALGFAFDFSWLVFEDFAFLFAVNCKLKPLCITMLPKHLSADAGDRVLKNFFSETGVCRCGSISVKAGRFCNLLADVFRNFLLLLVCILGVVDSLDFIVTLRGTFLAANFWDDCVFFNLDFSSNSMSAVSDDWKSNLVLLSSAFDGLNCFSAGCFWFLSDFGWILSPDNLFKTCPTFFLRLGECGKWTFSRFP